jgi:hypothetical protein
MLGTRLDIKWFYPERSVGIHWVVYSPNWQPGWNIPDSLKMSYFTIYCDESTFCIYLMFVATQQCHLCLVATTKTVATTHASLCDQNFKHLSSRDVTFSSLCKGYARVMEDQILFCMYYVIFVYWAWGVMLKGRRRLLKPRVQFVQCIVGQKADKFCL